MGGSRRSVAVFAVSDVALIVFKSSLQEKIAASPWRGLLSLKRSPSVDHHNLFLYLIVPMRLAPCVWQATHHVRFLEIESSAGVEGHLERCRFRVQGALRRSILERFHARACNRRHKHRHALRVSHVRAAHRPACSFSLFCVRLYQWFGCCVGWRRACSAYAALNGAHFCRT